MAIFAHDYMNKHISGYLIPEGVFLSSESFFLILLAPVLATLYGQLQKHKINPSPSKKIAFSLFFIAACFFVMMMGSVHIPVGARTADISWIYLIIAYFFMAVGEMLLVPVGLSILSRLAPPRYTALCVGLWYACVGIAFYIGGVLAGFMNKMGGLFNFFSLFVFLTAVPAVIMFLLSKKLMKMSHVAE
jgi:POT family proton-dependent oligopeptide transporter